MPVKPSYFENLARQVDGVAGKPVSREKKVNQPGGEKVTRAARHCAFKK